MKQPSKLYNYINLHEQTLTFGIFLRFRTCKAPAKISKPIKGLVNTIYIFQNKFMNIWVSPQYQNCKYTGASPMRWPPKQRFLLALTERGLCWGPSAKLMWALGASPSCRRVHKTVRIGTRVKNDVNNNVLKKNQLSQVLL